jgi:SAM-dependent methyltransferase
VDGLGAFQHFDDAEIADPAARADAEVASILVCASVEAPARVLDVGCGRGRHALMFAQRGFEVVGLDIDAAALEVAARAAADGGNPEFRCLDIRELPFTDEFDLVVNLHTSFGYFATEEEHQQALVALARALRPGGFLVLETINRDGQLAVLPGRSWELSRDHVLYLDRHAFDPVTGTLAISRTVVAADGPRQQDWTIRLFASEELARLLLGAGLVDVSLLAGFPSHDHAPQSRLEAYSPASPRICVIARRPGDGA